MNFSVRVEDNRGLYVYHELIEMNSKSTCAASMELDQGALRRKLLRSSGKCQYAKSTQTDTRLDHLQTVGQIGTSRIATAPAGGGFDIGEARGQARQTKAKADMPLQPYHSQNRR